MILEDKCRQTEFPFMQEVKLQCYNGLQIKYMQEFFRNYIGLRPEVEKVKPPRVWVDIYFKSDYAIRIANNLKSLIFDDQ